MAHMKKELLSVRIPVDLNRKLADFVAPIGISKAAFILFLISQALREDLQQDTDEENAGQKPHA